MSAQRIFNCSRELLDEVLGSSLLDSAEVVESLKLKFRETRGANGFLLNVKWCNSVSFVARRGKLDVGVLLWTGRFNRGEMPETHGCITLCYQQFVLRRWRNKATEQFLDEIESVIRSLPGALSLEDA